MIVQELFDDAYHFEIEDDDDDWIASFKDETGEMVSFIAEKYIHVTKIHFKRKGTWDVTNDDDPSKNIGVRIMGTILAILRKLVKDKNPKSMMFTAKDSEPSRISLYARLVQREAKKLGYVDCTNDEHRVVPMETQIINFTGNAKRTFKGHKVTLLVRKDLVIQD